MCHLIEFKLRELHSKNQRHHALDSSPALVRSDRYTNNLLPNSDNPSSLLGLAQAEVVPPVRGLSTGCHCTCSAYFFVKWVAINKTVNNDHEISQLTLLSYGGGHASSSPVKVTQIIIRRMIRARQSRSKRQSSRLAKAGNLVLTTTIARSKKP